MRGEKIAPLRVFPENRKQHITQVPTSHGQSSYDGQPFHALRVQAGVQRRWHSARQEDFVMRIFKVGYDFKDDFGRDFEDCTCRLNR